MEGFTKPEIKIMANRKQRIGKWGENAAASYLEDKGYFVIDRNYRTPAGEIDIIATEEDLEEVYLIFVEVKTRTSLKFGNPEDAVTGRKKDHLLAAINYYLEENSEIDLPWQIDVIAIQRLSQDTPPVILHFRNVFT